ncbi:MAG: aldo/keto reductase [Myxococcota bacterium]|nr:aldo/keto reductase [Myxococcota bacterium]
MSTQRRLGRTEIEIHPIVLGTFALGGWWWGPQDDTQAREAIEASIDSDACAIDTAPVYGFGHAETLIGEAIRGRRSRVQICTKLGLRWDGEGRFFFPAKHQGSKLKVCHDLRPAQVRKECEASLRRLQTDYIDLYQVHWPDPETPIADTMGALLRLKEEGKIRAIGVSNYSVDQMREAQAALGEIPLASTQPRYSLLHRKTERDVLPFCQEESVGLIGYRPLEQGLLTGKVGPDRSFEDGDERATQSIFSQDNRVRIQAALASLSDLAEDKEIASAQLAIAWVLHQRGVTGAICGARNATQARINAASAEVHLTAEECARIAGAFEGLPLRAKR